MVFTTQFYARLADGHRSLLVLAVLLLTGCSDAETGFGFKLERVDTNMTARGLEVVVHQKLVLSREARTALDHGVPLTVQTGVVLKTAGTHHDVEQEYRDFEIHYLPLSKRYQLTTTKPVSVSTFPRLRHVLAEIATVRFVLGHRAPPAEEYEVSVRSFLDTRRMPPPMRLPARFSSQWKHDSGWQTWPLSETARQPHAAGKASG